MIEFENVRFAYPHSEFELCVRQWRVAAEEHVAVIGPSGSGKTTLLHLAAGIVSPLSGAVRVAGHDISRQTDAERRSFRIRQIGLVFQEFELLEYLTVRDNILLPYRINPALPLDRAVRQRVGAVAEAVGLARDARPLPAPPVPRRASARRAEPRADHPAASDSGRRAHREPGPADQPDHRLAAAGSSPANPGHRADGHARPFAADPFRPRPGPGATGPASAGRRRWRMTETALPPHSPEFRECGEKPAFCRCGYAQVAGIPDHTHACFRCRADQFRLSY